MCQPLHCQRSSENVKYPVLMQCFGGLFYGLLQVPGKPLPQ